MLIYTITGDTVSINATERAYIEKRFKGFERFMDDDAPHEIAITAMKTTAHARQDTIRLEVKLKIKSQDFFASAEEVDIFQAADKAKEELMRVVTQTKARKLTLFHRAGRKLKDIIKNPTRKKN